MFGLFCHRLPNFDRRWRTWGLNHPVGWAWDITNFVFWIGIGHAGTLISAILFLLRQKWRTSINRSAEAMTLFAVMCAAIFPGIHVGRVWMAWYLAPIPNNYGIWPNFRSPLMWDVFAVSTYFTVSVLFWYTGLIPDLATLRDRATTKIKKFLFGIFACGWRGSNRNWRHYEMAYLLLAGLSTPLVLSVHSVVSFDFATSILPTWHTTIFPPYFVAGAIFGGFAMVLTLLIPARAIFKLHDIITPQHIDKMAKIILLTGSFVSYAYAMEFFVAWYSGNAYEQFAFWNRVFGPYWWYWWVGHAVLQHAFAAALLVPLVPAQHSRRLFRLHVRERRHVVRAFHHHRRRIASRFSSVFVGIVHPDLGRHLDVHRHVRNFHFALPAVHSLPADDRDVGSEDRFAGSRRALRTRLTDIIQSQPAEWSAHENAFRPRGLRDGGGVSERRRALRSGQNRARRRFQTLGCAFAVSDSRNGRRDGPRKIVAERGGLDRRHYRLARPPCSSNSARRGAFIR